MTGEINKRSGKLQVLKDVTDREEEIYKYSTEKTVILLGRYLSTAMFCPKMMYTVVLQMKKIGDNRKRRKNRMLLDCHMADIFGPAYLPNYMSIFQFDNSIVRVINPTGNLVFIDEYMVPRAENQNS